MSSYFLPADILLPDFEKLDGTAWSVVACDQYTSQPDYWSAVEERVGEAPSTLRLILPEIYLEQSAERVPAIHESMERYLKEVLVKHPNTMLYLEREQSNGRVRRGLVGAIDLEHYDYRKGSRSLIRATEGTVLDRIPPRLAVRRGAPLELPHVMLLIDDPAKSVIEPIAARTGRMEKLYDFPLMQKGGAVRAFAVDSVSLGRITSALEKLISPDQVRERYGEGVAPLLFAVGDGNHSLATAKAAYEELKEQHGDAVLFHPARYALVELVNLHDPALHFEPIYRVLFNVDPDNVLAEMERYSFSLEGNVAPQQLRFLSAKRRGTMHFERPAEQLVVGTLQTFIDGYLERHPEARVDYIHGAKTTEGLAKQENTVGFLFEGMSKDQLFGAVMHDGALPRKTFSMGAAADKRYYTECRKIR